MATFLNLQKPLLNEKAITVSTVMAILRVISFVLVHQRYQYHQY